MFYIKTTKIDKISHTCTYKIILTMTMKTILLNIKTVCSLYNIKQWHKKDVMPDFMSGDKTWKRRIR